MNAMRLTSWSTITALLVTTLLCATAAAEIPALLNYQVMLTDNVDQPLVDESVTMVFTIYDAESGGTALWTETHNPTTNSIGVVSVILGSITPIGFDFDEPMWLEVEVDGETLSPRRTLTAAPYAGHAAGADDSESLGGIDASEYALLTDLTGVGDGHSLDADDGDPVDALYVDADGNVRVGTQGEGRSLYVGGTSPDNALVTLEEEQYAGAVTIRGTSGSPVATLSSDSSQTDGGTLWLARNATGWGGFYARGNWQGSGEPRMSVSGTFRSATFDMSYEGTNSVQLPDDAISAAEVLDEPGVANIQTGSYAALTSSVLSVASRFIDAPAPGFVFVSATAVVEFDNRTNQGHYVEIALSELQNAFSSKAQEFDVSIPGGEYGHYYETVTVTGLFEVAAGVHTFYLNAREVAGECRVGPRNLNILYFPTAHGSTDFTD